MGDAGLTGRKIIDTYGGMARHGGGAFSGKDPSKVDRSAAYAMRWVAKNVVAAGLARRCEVQVAYAIGKAQPVGFYVDCFGTETVPVASIQKAVLEVFDLRPAAIIRDLDLLRPIYAQTAAYGHFGRELPDQLGEDRPRRRSQVRRGGLTSRTTSLTAVTPRPVGCGRRSAHCSTARTCRCVTRTPPYVASRCSSAPMVSGREQAPRRAPGRRGRARPAALDLLLGLAEHVVVDDALPGDARDEQQQRHDDAGAVLAGRAVPRPARAGRPRTPGRPTRSARCRSRLR